jgi:hypothetical protein
MGGCGGNEIDNNLMADKRLSSPVLTDIGKEPMFDLVPFAGAWGQVANRDLKTGFIGQFLQLGLPQPGPITVAASTHGREQQTTGSGVSLLAHHNPPAPEAFYGKSGGVMIRSHIDPPSVLRQTIHPLGSYLAKRGDLKIMDTDSLWVALGSKLPSIIFERPDKLLLFRIDRNDGLVGGLKFLDLLVNMLKLGIALRMRTPLKRLAVGLQAVAHLVKELGYQAVAALMSAPSQFLSQLANAFGGPAQRRLRIASGHRLDETFQVGAKGLIRVSGALASPTGFANAARDLQRQWVLSSFQELFATRCYGWPGNSGRLGNQSGASVPKSKRLCGNIEPQAPLIQQRSKQFIALPYQRRLHTNSITRQRKM